MRTGVAGGSRPSFQNGHERLFVGCARVTETIQRQLRRASHRALGVLSRVSQARESEFRRLGRTCRAVAARCAGVAETIQCQLRRASHRALGVLSRVPQARESEFRRLGRACRAVAARCAGVAETIQWHLSRVTHGGLRNTMAAALTAFATGAALVLIATGFLGRTAAPPDRVLPIAGRGPADQGPRAAPAPRASAPSHDEPRASPRIETATPVTAAPPADAKPQPTPATPDSRMASGPAAAVQPPAVAPPARPTPPVEVVAIRFGVIDRTLPKWTWSWRITIRKPSDTARVNARIEFIEFQGSTRRLIGYEQFCDLRLAGGQLVFIEGIHTLSAADSRRLSTMTATVSAATGAAELTTCRPRSSSGRPPPARDSRPIKSLQGA